MMDRDRDGKISAQDFSETVAEQPLLMEAFGQCLPYSKGKYSQIKTNITCKLDFYISYKPDLKTSVSRVLLMFAIYFKNLCLYRYF